MAGGKEGEKGEDKGSERALGEKKGEEKGEEEARRKGRKTNAERLTRERSMSGGNVMEIAEMWKRKREKEEERRGEGGEGEEAFMKSRKVQRSPEEKRVGDHEALESLIKGMREEMRKDLREVKEQGREAKEEMEKIRGKMEEWEDRWRREKEEMKDRMIRLEKRMGEAELEEGRLRKMEERLKAIETWRGREGTDREKGERGERAGRESGGEEWEARVQEVERKLEMKEREGKRKNVIIKGVGREGTAMQRAKEILAIVGIKGGIEGAKELGGGRQERKEVMLEVRMENMEAKREVMRNKGKLRGRKERLEDDLTWKERKMQWRLRRLGEEEEAKGKRVRVSYGKIVVDGITWFWDERREELRDWRGREKGGLERETREGSKDDRRREEGEAERRSKEREGAKN